MTAVTVSYTSIANSAVDADSPVTEALVTALRDNAQFVYEWLGASYAGGAVQNHNHDGSNSSLLTIGPNAIRNGSFEENEIGWTFTDYSGGSHAQETSNDMHGANSMSMTSTVLANGGAYAVSNEFLPIGEDEFVAWAVYIKASVANISARVEIIWYDDAQSQISATQIVDLTNTPASATLYNGDQAVVSTARYFKLRITGGVPAAGSATGTVYFDGVHAHQRAPVSQNGLKTTTASGSTTLSATSAGTYTLTGGTYAWWTSSSDNPTVSSNPTVGFGNGNQAAGVIGLYNPNGSSTRTIYFDERYVQSSPPYDIGDGVMHGFAMALVDNGTGTVEAASFARDPVWQAHSPVNLKRSTFVSAEVAGVPLADAMRNDPGLRNRIIRGEVPIERRERPVTDAMRQALMGQFAHNWVGNDLTGKTVVMVDPISDFIGRLAELADVGGMDGAREVRNLLQNGQIQLDNTPIANRKAWAGVMPVAATLRNTP